MVRINILSQKMVNYGGALLLECPCASVDIFNIINVLELKN